MDRRSWPWKKKSSDKTISDKAMAVGKAVDSANGSVSAEAASTQENFKKPSYVQISVESYTHFTGLEDQVKSYEEQVQTLDSQIVELNEKLSAAHEEIVTKEGLVKQHAKVAEEAVSGWEKAETEASTLKTQLEAVTLEKLTVEDRAAHLDSALKECMRQIRILKEEHEQELHDVIFSKTKQFEKLQLELESKMANLNQELLKSEAENAALARSLQERSNMLIRISEQKSQAEAEIEHLKGTIESCEREISSLKYELHIAAKELEIRTEEKNMSVRSADVANKQHVEAAKKITKLEAECQRLRGLVRKKLPGPAALAQMKLEVESLGRDFGDNRRRSSGRTSSPHSPFPDFQLDELHKIQKDNEFLTERLLAMEEDSKLLKEALAKRNIELQDSRDLCATISNKLQSVEKTQSDSKNMPKLVNTHSLTSMSEDGNDYAPSSAESWSTGLNSDLSQCKQGKSESANHLDLMDDFLEMEKLACSSNDSTGLLADPNGSTCTTSGNTRLGDKVETTAKDLKPELQHDSTPTENNVSSDLVNCPKSDVDQLPLMKLQSRISVLFEYISKESDGIKILEDMRTIVNDMHDSLHHQSSCCDLKKMHCSDTSSDRQIFPEDAGMSLTTVKEISPSQDSAPISEKAHSINKETVGVINQIQDFMVSLGKAAEAVQDPSTDGDGLAEQIKEFSTKFSEGLNEKTSVIEFVADVSNILHRANELRFNFLGFKVNDAETNGTDCIDKVALPEHKVVSEDINGEAYTNGCSDSGSDREVPSSGNLVLGVELKTTSRMCPLEDFEKLKIEKENLIIDLVRCSKDLENVQSQLLETEGKLSELKSELAMTQKSNSLAETQLKCMVESYRSLEIRAEELEEELNALREKATKLEDELQEEKTKHQDALDRCHVLEEQLQRNSSNSEPSMSDADHKTKQEKELAAAAEKLAECQETIFLLGRQLKSLRPQTDAAVSPQKDIVQRVSSPARDEYNLTFETILDLDRAKMEAAVSSGTLYRTGCESPMTDTYNALYIPSDSEANSYLRSPISTKHHKSTHSLPPAYAAQTPEKHSRGISRFFSTKGKF
uniref:Filament-like plant protein 4 n=1 Tax=Kalanchoe fedtschenkoi TaxID=63787 RepID=A0A7N0R9U1_KALFE